MRISLLFFTLLLCSINTSIYADDDISNSTQLIKKVYETTQYDLLHIKEDGIRCQLLSVFFSNGMKAYKFRVSDYGFMSYFKKRKIEYLDVRDMLVPITDNETLISIFFNNYVIGDDTTMVLITDPNRKPKTRAEIDREALQILEDYESNRTQGY